MCACLSLVCFKDEGSDLSEIHTIIHAPPDAVITSTPLQSCQVGKPVEVLQSLLANISNSLPGSVSVSSHKWPYVISVWAGRGKSGPIGCVNQKPVIVMQLFEVVSL